MKQMLRILRPAESTESDSTLSFDTLQGDVQILAKSIGGVIKGKTALIRDFLVAVLAGGSILLEDLPGIGKTTMAKTFAELVDLKFNRLQCTPDLLPADVLGFSIYNPRDASFEFRGGPIFCNVLLVDEINRASPRTQAALLEAMAEHQVTAEGNSRSLPSPFLVIATQNPHGFHGTYPLPEAQLDRFLFQLSLDYPDQQSEIELLYDADWHKRVNQQPVMSAHRLSELQSQVRSVKVKPELAEYLVNIVRATRNCEDILIGCSPRGSQMFFRAAQAQAFVWEGIMYCRMIFNMWPLWS